ncbi:MAG: VOC family protein [Cyanobacteria bacterium P01_D01_bin.14]
MIDHLSLPVSDILRSQLFYDQILSALGCHPMMTVNESDYVAIGYGREGQEPVFWIGAGKTEGPPVSLEPLVGHHIAFSAASREAVDHFYQAGLHAGGKDNGPPGLRPHYHPNYYGAFLIDPDGHHLEAVCHIPVDVSEEERRAA